VLGRRPEPAARIGASGGGPLARIKVTLGIQSAHEIADELANAFVIEKNRHASRGDVNGNAISDYQGVWVIYLEAVSVDQRHGKWSKWPSLFERFQNVIKVFCFH
jgi:hypothetical protein